jgi:hypothetical protein
VFIDPENCGSSVGYYITIGEYHSTKTDKDVHSLSATVVLTDCNHKIDWCFSGNGKTDKIDSAISMLQEFRKKYAETEKLVAKLNK